MKRSLFGRTLKKTFLTVPAAALMLGVSQAQTSLGINFSGGAYASDYGTSVLYNGNTYTFSGPSYFCGFPVTAAAFGVAAADWNSSINGANANCFPFNYSANGTMIVGTAGSLTVNWTSPDCWGSHIGLDSIITNSAGYMGPPPGNDEVTWGFLDISDTGWSVNLSGLNATFPNGYVIQCIAASGDTGTKVTSSSQVTDGASFTNSFQLYQVDSGFGTVGLQVPSPVLTNNTLALNPVGNIPSLSRFILTDKPVVSQPLTDVTNFNGSTLVFSAIVPGLPPLSYQWLHDGTNMPGATAASYTNTSVRFTDAGDYSVVVTNPYGTASNVVDTLTIVPMTLQIVSGGVVQNSKLVGISHDGDSVGTTWTNSSTDFNSVTRSGVEQFVQTNNSRIVVPPSPDFNSTNGTICFWMKYALSGSFPGPGQEAAILFDRRTTDGTVIAANVNGNIQFQSAGGARFVSSTTSGYVVNGNWHHVAITYGQTTNDAVSLYIDGVVDTVVTNPGSWIWPTNVPIELGRTVNDQTSNGNSYWFIYDGQMDDFRMYNRILTTNEISVIGTPATSDSIEETNALVLRFNFNSDSALFGHSIVWPHGALLSSPVLGPGAVWTPVLGAPSPSPITPSAPAMFYRLGATP